MSAGPRYTLPSILGSVLRCVLGLFWLVAGFGKLDQLWNPPTIHEADIGTWSQGFPVLLLVIVAVHEVFAGYLILAGRRVAGLALGLGLLASFSFALFIWPPALGQPCGCSSIRLGTLGEYVDPIAKNFLVASFHLVALWVWRPAIVTNDRGGLTNEAELSRVLG